MSRPGVARHPAILPAIAPDIHHPYQPPPAAAAATNLYCLYTPSDIPSLRWQANRHAKSQIITHTLAYVYRALFIEPVYLLLQQCYTRMEHNEELKVIIFTHELSSLKYETLHDWKI